MQCASQNNSITNTNAEFYYHREIYEVFLKTNRRTTSYMQGPKIGPNKAFTEPFLICSNKHAYSWHHLLNSIKSSMLCHPSFTKQPKL
jgi:hypothetical protein